MIKLYGLYGRFRNIFYETIYKRISFKSIGVNVYVNYKFEIGHSENVTIGDNVLIGKNNIINGQGGYLLVIM